MNENENECAVQILHFSGQTNDSKYYVPLVIGELDQDSVG